MAVLKDIMMDPEAKNSDRISAANILLDRGHGKAPQAIAIIDQPEKSAVDLTKLSADEVRMMHALVLKGSASDAEVVPENVATDPEMKSAGSSTDDGKYPVPESAVQSVEPAENKQSEEQGT